jgi:hypothetical protein
MTRPWARPGFRQFWLASVVGMSGLAIAAGPVAIVPQAVSATNTPTTAQARSFLNTARPDSSLPGGMSFSEFKNPANQFKPATRWWWQGPLNEAEAIRELQVIADAGFGEVEIAFSRGAGAWATEEQRVILGKVLDEAHRLDIKVSMTMGAAWPVQTPNTGEGSGHASQELQYGRADIAAGGEFSGPVPEPIDAAELTQPRTLVAVTAARVLEAGPPVTAPGVPPAKATVLDPDSLTDLTDQVVDGTITWRPPGNGNWILFSFWARENEAHNTNPFDADAARQATKDLDEIQIGEANTPRLRQAGADLFEDSLELHGTSIFWTQEMVEQFQERRGYDMAKYLPMMFVQGVSDFPVPPKEPPADFDLPDGHGAKIRDDYYTTLTDLYVDEHLSVFQDWAESYDMQYKAQAAFLQNLEPIRSMRELIALGGRAETESLNAGENLPITMEDPAWRNSLDFQRKLASGVHQAGDTQLSTELGAIFKPAYSMNLDDYKELLNKEWAAGVSQPFIHGVALQRANAAWPGTARFGERVTESWNDQTFPQWSSWPALNAYFARGTRVLETGTAKADVVVYSDSFLSPRGNKTPFDALRLEKEGFSVEYVDPEGLAEHGAPSDGELFPDASGYRAIVVDQRAISLSAAEAILTAAKEGVRVVFVGDLPNSDTTFATGADGDDAVKQTVEATLDQDSATRVGAQSDVGDALGDLGLTPRVKSFGTHILSQWRQAEGGAYVYLYNPADAPVSFAASFETEGVPYELGLWDGSVSPIAQFDHTDGRTVVPLTLDAHEGVVIAISTDANVPVRVVDSEVPEAGDLVLDGDKIVFRATESGEHRFELSNGDSSTVDASIVTNEDQPLSGPGSARPSIIDQWSTWTLTAEVVSPSGPRTVTASGRLGDSQFQQLRLREWRSIAGLSGESGVGTYTASTTLPEGWNADPADGAWLDLGRVDGTADLSVNGQYVGTQINSGRRWDVTPYLQAGLNTVEVKVRTTLRNAVTTYLRASTDTQPYGLRGPVTLQPYDGVVVYDANEDACPDGHSPFETVVFGDVDSGVTNYERPDGCTILDLVFKGEPFANHGAFVRQVERITTSFVDDDLLTTRERGRILRAAGSYRP